MYLNIGLLFVFHRGKTCFKHDAYMTHAVLRNTKWLYMGESKTNAVGQMTDPSSPEFGLSQ